MASRSYARTFLSILIALALSLAFNPMAPKPAAGDENEPAHVPKTDFLPSRDMLQIPNPVGGENAARYGSCHGLVEAAIYYKTVRDGENKIFGPGSSHTQRPTLAEVTREVKNNYPQGDVILKGLGIAEQQHAYDQQEYVIKTDQGKRTIFENLKQGLDSGNPVRLTLSGVENRGASHVVVAYDYYRGGNGNLYFRVGDPNQPSNDKAEIVWDAKTKKFGQFSSGGMEFSPMGVQTALERDPAKLIMNIEAARVGNNPARDIPANASHSLEPPTAGVTDRVLATFDKVIGGVIIRYPSSWTQTTADDPAMRAICDQVAQFVDEQQEGACVFSLTPQRAQVQLVSLRRLLASGSTTLGDLTSVRGFVIDDNGNLLIAGTVDHGSPRIPLDWFTVALKAVWRGGQAPFVSLDPDPMDFSRPHHARIGGLPPDCTSSDFVRVLLEADYLMKRIGLGVEKPALADFSSWYDMLAASPDGSAPGMHRDWLSPMIYPAADVYTASQGAARAVWFDDGVQVMTENLKRSRDGLVGTGQSDPIADRAAAELTRHYGELAHLYPNEFGKLSAIFDLCKLCAILRGQTVKSAQLDALCDRSVPGGLTRNQYAGIQPREVGNRNLSVSGGAITRQRVHHGKAIQAAQLTMLISAARDMNGTQTDAGELQLPATLHVDPDSLKYFNADLHVNAAIERLQNGQYEEAQKRLDLALMLDADCEGAHFYRAIARFSDGRLKDASSDIDIAVAGEPRAQGFRAILRACGGQESAALRDATDAEAKFPQDTGVLAWCAMARYYAEDFRNCEKISSRMLAMSPLDRDGLTLRTMLGAIHRLGPDASRQRVRAERQVPLALTDALGSAYGAIMGLDVVAACDSLDRASRLCDRHASNPAVQQLHLRERVEFQTIVCANIASTFLEKLGSSQEAEVLKQREARAAEDLVTAHPNWPSACAARAMVVPRPGEPDERAKYMVKVIDLDPSGDPLLEEMNQTLGTRYARALCLFSLQDVRPHDQQTEFKFAEFVFRSPNDPQLTALWDQLKKYKTEDPPPELMKHAQQVLFGFADRNKGDPFAIQLCCGFAAPAAMNAADKKDLKEFLAKIKPLLRCINQNGLPENVMNMVAMAQQVLWMRLGEFYSRMFKEDPRLNDLRSMVQEGQPDPVAIDAQLARVRNDVVGRIDPDLSAATVAAAKSAVETAESDLRKELRQAAEDRAGKGDDQRAQVATLLEKWKPGEQNDRLLDFLNVKSIPLVKYETELRSITLMLDILARAIAIGRSADPVEAGKFSDTLSTVRADIDAKSKVLRFQQSPLDWSEWKGAAEDEDVIPGSRTSAMVMATKTFFARNWIIVAVVVCAGGAGVALGALIVLLALKQRPRKQ